MSEGAPHTGRPLYELNNDPADQWPRTQEDLLRKHLREAGAFACIAQRSLDRAEARADALARALSKIACAPINPGADPTADELCAMAQGALKANPKPEGDPAAHFHTIGFVVQRVLDEYVAPACLTPTKRPPEPVMSFDDPVGRLIQKVIGAGKDAPAEAAE